MYVILSAYHKIADLLIDVQQSNMLIEVGVIAVITSAISKFSNDLSVVGACYEFISSLKTGTHKYKYRLINKIANCL